MNKKLLIYLVINIIIFAEFGYIGYTNFTALIAHNPQISHYELFYVLLTVATLSMVIGIYIMTFLNMKREKKIGEYKRELERRGIDRDESSSKVKVLESKIEVLEKALKEAIKNKEN